MLGAGRYASPGTAKSAGPVFAACPPVGWSRFMFNVFRQKCIKLGLCNISFADVHKT